MAVHPGKQERQFSEKAPVAWDPIRQALEENEDWHRDLAQNSHDLLCVHDLEGRLLSVNPTPAHLLGYSVDEILRKQVQELIDPRYRAEFDDYVCELKSNAQSHGRMMVVTKSGERRIWEYRSSLRTEGVEAPIARVIAHDVTEHARAEKALRTMNEELLQTTRKQEFLLRELTLFRTLLDESNDAIQVIEPETLRLLDVNKRTCVELGYSREELLGMTVYDIAPEFDQQARREVMRQLDDSGSAIVERVHRRKDGTAFPVEVNLRRVYLDREYGVAITRDITARKHAEAALRAKHEELLQTAREREKVLHELELFRALLDQSNDAVEVIDPESMRLLDVNERECVELGYSREELLTMTVYDIDPNVDRSMQAPVLRELRATGFLMMESLHRRKNGTTFPVEVNIRRVQLEREYLLAVARNITRRKGAELREREYERVVEGVDEMIVVVDREYRAVLANRAYLQYRGLRREQALGRPLWEIVGKAFFETVIKAKIDESFTGKVVRYEKKAIYPSLGERDICVSYFPIEGPQGIDRIAVILKDITDQKSAEAALRQSEERFRVALKNSPIAVFSQDRDLRYTWMYNPQLGYSPAGMLGKNTSEFVNAEESKRFAETRRRVLETGVGVRHEVQFMRDGRQRFMDVTIEPLLDAAGKVVGLTGASMDVTELRETTEALREAKKKLTEEKLYLEREIDAQLGFGEIIGQSKALQSVMEQVSKVAASAATVLVLGETGTGKELVARAIHRLSHRSGSSFIKMNCAAIPSGLLESELFGNERGAFTGAVSRKIGRLELADKGTLFLDEIGEIPLALQPKLLRVLQDQEFERLGGTHTLKVDFRLIAATNRDLADSVREHEFRSDLFYRLNVFPIRMPPLRERCDDIRLLVEYFVQKHARRMNKSITSVPRKTLDALMAWEWPGNVRELENFVERSVILSQGSVLVSPLSELTTSAEPKGVTETLAATEREHILRALRRSHGQVGGPKGAAKRLGLKRTTLQSKLKQLGIDPRSAIE